MSDATILVRWRRKKLDPVPGAFFKAVMQWSAQLHLSGYGEATVTVERRLFDKHGNYPLFETIETMEWRLTFHWPNGQTTSSEAVMHFERSEPPTKSTVALYLARSASEAVRQAPRYLEAPDKEDSTSYGHAIVATFSKAMLRCYNPFDRDPN